MGEDAKCVGQDDPAIDAFRRSVAELARVAMKLHLPLNAETAYPADGVADTEVTDHNGTGVGRSSRKLRRGEDGRPIQARLCRMEAGKDEAT